MTNESIFIYNHLTGEEIVREMTDEEQAKRDAQVVANLEAIALKKQAEIEARNVKVSAYKKLGLTEAEIDSLVPPLEI